MIPSPKQTTVNFREYTPLSPGLILVTALLPIVAANVCYAISAAGGHIPLCLTYIDGCTSISSTGRHGIAYVLFKLAMLPQAALFALFWRGYTATMDPTHTRAALTTARRFGMVGAAFLVIYVVTLGADSALYSVMRRYGVFVYFIGTFVAMCCVSVVHWRHDGARPAQRILAVLCVAMLLLGLAEIPLGKFGLADNQAENIIEWNFALLMQCWFLTIWWIERTARAT